jgi:hypothetical protein
LQTTLVTAPGVLKKCVQRPNSKASLFGAGIRTVADGVGRRIGKDQSSVPRTDSEQALQPATKVRDCWVTR